MNLLDMLHEKMYLLCLVFLLSYQTKYLRTLPRYLVVVSQIFPSVLGRIEIKLCSLCLKRNGVQNIRI
uniref:Putative secreted protein n=1 Tax=Anopheles marajoara TaxID=58244 RepID=A0A2M4CFE3_9DIPT